MSQWQNFENKTNVLYLSPEKQNKKYLKTLMNETHFDIAYINGIYSYFFSILPLKLLKKTGKKTIIAPRGMLSEQAFSSKEIKKRVFLNIAKLSGLYKKVIFQATYKNEINDIKNILSKKTNVIFTPNLPRKLFSLNRKKTVKHEQLP